jgi:cystathionine gamma-lyase
MADRNLHIETLAIHAGEEPDFREGAYGDVAAPIHLSSTFARRKVDEPTAGLEYSRSGNPTRHALEAKLAALEGGEFALAFASGLAAETTLLLTLVKPGDHIVAFDDLYGGTGRIFRSLYNGEGITPAGAVETTYVDAVNTDAVRDAIRPNTKLVWMESPSNPLLKLCDIAASAQLAHAAGALLVVDNTFMSPALQNPLALGADIVVHSTTKYVNGHSDSVGGALIYSGAELDAKLRFSQNAYGAILSPFDSYLVMRGLKTLGVRMRQHSENALAIARHLEAHTKIKRVIYPGLPSHPQHEMATRQARGFGGMVSFELDGDLAGTNRFLEALRIFALAESLGGVESLIEHPAPMTHASVPAEMRLQLGISDTLIRVSCGIEHVDDLIADIERGLAAV